VGVNRETKLLERAFSRIPKIGRALVVIFAAASCIGILMIAAIAVSFFVALSAGEQTNVSGVQIAYELIGQAAMLAVYVSCALVARDMSRGETPFSNKQSKRVFVAACVMTTYVICCFVWDPLFSTIQANFGLMSMGYSAHPEPTTFFINFGALTAALVLFLLAYVLDYGKTLQMFADETQ
jgi:hypothetical protein